MAAPLGGKNTGRSSVANLSLALRGIWGQIEA
jgi:hypothetical protein